MLTTLLVAVIVAGLIYWVFQVLPFPEPFKSIALCICIIILILWLLGATGIAPGLT